MQNLLGVLLQKCGDIDRGKQHVAQLLRRIDPFFDSVPQLCRLFFQFTQTLRSRFPGKAALCGFFLKLFAAPRCRQRTRHAI